jgi:hypothetical protein
MGGVFSVHCTVYGYDNQAKKGKGEKRKEGDGVCMHIVYIIIWDRVVDLI